MPGPTQKPRAPRNRSVTLSSEDISRLSGQVRTIDPSGPLEMLRNRTLCGDSLLWAQTAPDNWVDLLFLDPPYNLEKSFNGRRFAKQPSADYETWLESWLTAMLRLCKPTASVYLCGDWRSSGAIEHIAGKHLILRNRITWEREKGRGAQSNWKNAHEDIWFGTLSEQYTFNLDQVKLKRKVIAPYTDQDRRPKDWQQTEQGRFRLTHPSNLWTDLTVPFWSMPENTDHPTQKPEKLLARIILASSNPGDMVLDPFLGSGTTSVVAHKLSRHYCGVEIDQTYCLLAEKRLEMAHNNTDIQGYQDGFFWERNSGKPAKTPDRNTV